MRHRPRGPFAVVVVAASLAAPLVVVAACGSSSEGGATPPPLSTNGPSPSKPASDAGSAEEPRDAFVLEASETAKTYAGSLAATQTVAFGGGGYCNYKITLKDVAVELVILETGDVAGATVRDLAVEEAVSCPYAPADPSIQDFAFKASSTTAAGVHVDFTGSKNNRPETSLAADLVVSGNAYDATFTWKRTDQGPPLAWTVTAKIRLARK